MILLCFLITGLYFENQRWDLASRLLWLEASAALVQMYSARLGRIQSNHCVSRRDSLGKPLSMPLILCTTQHQSLPGSPADHPVLFYTAQGGKASLLSQSHAIFTSK